jgi:predicted transcriptional regulator
MAMVVRRWTAPEFARDAGINRCSVYNAINGRRLRDATALRIFETLATREPMALTG